VAHFAIFWDKQRRFSRFTLTLLCISWDKQVDQLEEALTSNKLDYETRVALLREEYEGQVKDNESCFNADLRH